ncbi:hypothetical protein L1987_15892 [Smallanthus sonchifolius]|uniref:Uncharacterized protein n=1 Tax=Smallanthus sonchifolius TaxID=185202 RepID=A0ACB9J7U7_9ASTR|nr:hypothetical protein L1987_15892 [Smallanthus sonchifolius]
MKLMLLLLVLFNFSSPLSFAHIANNYSGKLRIDEASASVSRDDNRVVNESKFAHASASGGGGGGHSNGGNFGNGGESISSQRGGGGGVIPVYAAAGANAKPNNNRNAANAHRSCRKDWVLIVIATGLSSLLLYMCV